jgi:hypothetical protein
MSGLVEKLFDGLQSAKAAAVAIFPALENFKSEIKAEVSRLNVQAPAELAAALFNGHGYVQYGAGQHTQSPAGHQQDHAHESHEMDMERER